ncbi:MAG: TatD family hydrolase [Bacteroidia bacterium]
MIDTHSHLYADQFDADRKETVLRAKLAGVKNILLPNIDLESLPKMEELYMSDSLFFRKMYGLHPCSVDSDYEEVLSEIKLKLDTSDCIAIGEIGIDLYWDKTKRDIQEKAFLMQCRWAEENKLPIAIHSRESTDIIINLIKENCSDELTGVFHCFVGTKEQAEEIIDMGFYLGIGGVVTFKNSGLRNELVGVPIERIVIETDSPYLAPVPYRGKRNESSYIIEVVRELSKIYKLSEEEVRNITTENAVRLFKL